MKAFRRLGLQKRVMLYVTAGLVAMFAAFSWAGMDAVRRATDVAFDERLAIAQSAAGNISREFDHLARDTREWMTGLSPDSGAAELQRVTGETAYHLGATDSFAFFTVRDVLLVLNSGEIVASATTTSRAAMSGPPSVSAAEAVSGSDNAARVFWAADSRAGQFASVTVPLVDGSGDVWARAVVETEAATSAEAFVPFGLTKSTAAGGEGARQPPAQGQYHLEVLASDGTTILGIGPEERLGGESEHYPIIRSLMDAGESDVMLHDVPPGSGDRDHVMAVVPVPGSELYLVLEQDVDIALALPNAFRRRLIIGGSLGFFAALAVAWVTTRYIVKPTRELTAAAVRMGEGDLATAIPVRAQDEIGVLAENLEAMRQRLNSALEEVETTNRELESRVHERTLRLRELVRHVLTAQEEERSRVALELHDETAQVIAALSVRLDQVANRSTGLAPEDAERLRESRRLATGLLTGIRRLIQALRPVALEEMGLVAALRRYAEELFDAAGAQVRMGGDDTGPGLPGYLELTLYRIGQEALNNVARHADAKSVWIDIEHADHCIRLTVRDDGLGFDLASLRADDSAMSGLGLEGMQERAALVGGRVTVESARGRGTTVRVEVPLGGDA